MRSIQACLRSLTAGLFKGGVVEQNLDAVGACFLEAADAPDVEQVGQAAGRCRVVPGLLIGKQEAGVVTVFCGLEAELRVQQDGRCMPGEDLGDERLELC